MPVLAIWDYSWIILRCCCVTVPFILITHAGKKLLLASISSGNHIRYNRIQRTFIGQKKMRCSWKNHHENLVSSTWLSTPLLRFSELSLLWLGPCITERLPLSVCSLVRQVLMLCYLWFSMFYKIVFYIAVKLFFNIAALGPEKLRRQAGIQVL